MQFFPPDRVEKQRVPPRQTGAVFAVRSTRHMWLECGREKYPRISVNDQEVETWNQSSEITGMSLNRVGQRRG